MSERAASQVTFVAMIVTCIAWTVWGIDQGIPLAIEELARAGVIEIGNPGLWGVLASIVLLLAIFPFWVGIPLYAFFLVQEVQNGRSLSEAIANSVREYFSVSCGAVLGLLAFALVATIGRALFTALCVGGFVVWLSWILIAAARSTVGRQ